MAHDWIKMRCDLADDPAVIGIAAATGFDEFAVVGRLHRLWSWADCQLTDGNARSVTLEWVDRYLAATGFGAAMVGVCWLRVVEDGLEFPNFDRHNLKTGKQRALTANRAARHRMKSNAASNAPRNAASVTKSAPTQPNTTQQSPPPTPSINAQAASGVEERWGEVGRKLRDRGISCEADAVATADARGLTPGDVLDLIDEWDRNEGAYGPGALFQRITGQLRSWPPAAAGFERTRAREQTFRSHQAVVAEREAGQHRRALDNQRLAALNAKHGATIAAMSADDVVAALESPQLVARYRSSGVTGLVRDRLFDVLEEAAGANTEATA